VCKSLKWILKRFEARLFQAGKKRVRLRGDRLAVKKLNMRRFPKLFWAFMRPVLLFPAGLYLLGFGLFPVAKGLQDWLLPYEQFGCTVLGTLFFAWFAVSYYRLWGLLRSNQEGTLTKHQSK
jgi:hypothetical protein